MNEKPTPFMTEGTYTCPYVHFALAVAKLHLGALAIEDAPEAAPCSYIGPTGPCQNTFSITETTTSSGFVVWHTAMTRPDGAPTTACQERTDNLEVFGQELLTAARHQKLRNRRDT